MISDTMIGEEEPPSRRGADTDTRPKAEPPSSDGPERLADLTGQLTIGTRTIRKVLLVLGAAALLWGPYNAANIGMRYPEAGGIFILCFFASVTLAVLAIFAWSDRALRYVDIALSTMAVLLIAGWGVTYLYIHSGPQTDEEVFIQHASTLLLHGVDPYTRSLSFGHSDHLSLANYTPLLDGKISDHLDYPPGSVLLSALFTHISGSFYPIAVVNLLAVAACVVLLYVMLPDPVKPISVIIAVALPTVLYLGMDGLTQTTMLPFLLVIAYRWHRVGRGGRLGGGGAMRAICLGLACSIQQLAWFVVPFLLVGMYLCRRDELGRRRTTLLIGRYVAVAVAAFLAVNLWFIIWAPGPWLAGELAPFTQHAVPMGVGLVTLLYSAHLGGGSLTMYSLSAAVSLPAMLLVYVLYFRRLASACFILASIPLMLTSRSLATYVVPLTLVWLTSLITSPPAVFSKTRPTFPALRLRRRRAISWLAFAAIVATAFVTVFYPQPMTVKIEQSAGSPHWVNRLTVWLHNTSGQLMRPHFMTATPLWVQSPYWHVLRGPATLPAGASATYLLRAPNGWPGNDRSLSLRVEVVNSSPASVSMSPTFHAPASVPSPTTTGTVPAGGKPGTQRGTGSGSDTGIGNDGVPVHDHNGGTGSGTSIHHSR